MGSQFAPVLCSAVALQREWNYHLSFSPFTWDRSLHHRYVDNRILLISQHSQCQTHVRVFWNLQFYSSPILLEVVEGQEALGFNVDAFALGEYTTFDAECQHVSSSFEWFICSIATYS